MSVSTFKQANRDSSGWRRYAKRRYTILFYTLLAMLVAMPVVSSLGLSPALMRAALAASLLAAVMPNSTKHSRWALFGSVLLLVLMRALAERGIFPGLTAPVLALYGVVGLITAALALRFVILSEEVNSETVFAALSTYLLAGIFFGFVYSAIEAAVPGSFSGPDPFNEAAAIYYSFVTLATLGYGDFLPRTELARGIATFEVIGGQLYLAVMVARLIGAFGFAKED